MPNRIFRAILALLLVLAFIATDARAAQGTAHIVFVGEAADRSDVRAVLSELLERSHVTPEFEVRDRFRSSALLSTEPADSRVWVFVQLAGSRRAKLYFRGPSGERFLLRTLALKRGLDEVGRELVAQVVETSTVALLRSEAGVSREEAKASLTEQGEEPEPDEPVPKAEAPASRDAERDSGEPPQKTPSEHAFRLELAARGTAKWAGSDLGLDHGIGAEIAFGTDRPRGISVRARALAEYGFGQSFESNALVASVRTVSVRGGVDLGVGFGVHGLAFGVLAGLDASRLSPTTQAGSGLSAAPDSSSTAPLLRLEARYELRLASFCASAGGLTDVALVDTHYDVVGPTATRQVAAPSRLRPGLAFTIGWCPTL